MITETVVAIDVGTKRCGIAYSIEEVPIPWKVVPLENLIQEIKNLLREKTFNTIVLGAGGDKITMPLVKKVAQTLQKELPNKKIIIIDEHYTTRMALDIEKKIKKRNEKTQIDKVSASLILETFLKMQSNQE